MNKTRLFAASAAIAMAMGVSTQSMAQGVALEEIVVTSRRVEEKLQDVPLAVTAITEQTLQTLKPRDTATLAFYAPSLQFSDYAPGNQRNDRGPIRPLIFRGLTLLNVGGTSNVTAAAGTFLDGAPVIGNEIPPGLDIARVEVLRGPQSVYFGRSTMTGAVSYTTKDVGNEFHAQAEATGATYETLGVEASVSGPIIRDKLGLRISASETRNSGYYDNAFNPTEQLGARNNKSVSLTANAQPFEGLKLKAFVSGVEYRDGLSAMGRIPPTETNCTVGTRAFFCGGLPKFKPVYTWNETGAMSPAERNFIFNLPLFADSPRDQWVGMQRKIFLSHLGATYDLGEFATLQSITAYHSDKWLSVSEYLLQPYLPTPARPFTNRRANSVVGAKTRDWSQELRLSSVGDDRLRWTLGGSYTFAKTVAQAATWQQSTTQFLAGLPGVGVYQALGISRAAATGVFGGLYYKVLEPLTVSLEGRYQVDDRLDSAGGTTLSNKFKSFSPRVSVDYHYSPNVTIYGSYAEGNRPGGFNRSLLPYVNNPAVLQSVADQAGGNNTAYSEERLNTWELGLKGVFFDNKVRANIDVYRGTLTGQQIANSAFVQQINATVTVTANQGSTRIWGLEFDGAWQVNDLLQLSGTFAWNKSKTLVFRCNSCVPLIGTNDISGRELPFAPEFSGSLAADVRKPTGVGEWDAFGHVDYVYRHWNWLDNVNLLRNDPRHIVNVRGGFDNGQIMVEGFVTNLLNDRHFSGGDTGQDFGSFLFTTVTFALPDPRVIGGRVRFKY